MRIATCAALAVVAGASWAVSAGDYGLNVDDRVRGCRSISHTNSACDADTVVADLRGRFVEGRAFQTAAVRVGLAHCSVWFAGPAERGKVYRALAGLAAEPTVSSEPKLLDAIGCFPFSGMRAALDAEVSTEHAPAVRARLRKARERVHGPRSPGS